MFRHGAINLETLIPMLLIYNQQHNPNIFFKPQTSEDIIARKFVPGQESSVYIIRLSNMSEG